MALFGLNWEESKWPGHFCSIVLYFFASKIGVKLPPEKKVPWHRRGAARSSRWKSHFSQKNAFFGQKKAFFQKVHFIQKCSVTQNTVFQCVKNIFFLSQKKLVFFTEFNLTMVFDFWSKYFKTAPIWLEIEVKFTSFDECLSSNFTSNFGHIGLFIRIFGPKIKYHCVCLC